MREKEHQSIERLVNLYISLDFTTCHSLACLFALLTGKCFNLMSSTLAFRFENIYTSITAVNRSRLLKDSKALCLLFSMQF